MANLSGHDSHGIGMLPRYVDAVLEGGLIPNAAVATQVDIGSMLTLNGQRGFGQRVAFVALESVQPARLAGPRAWLRAVAAVVYLAGLAFGIVDIVGLAQAYF